MEDDDAAKPRGDENSACGTCLRAAWHDLPRGRGGWTFELKVAQKDLYEILREIPFGADPPIRVRKKGKYRSRFRRPR